jgi:hypothetical protein
MKPGEENSQWVLDRERSEVRPEAPPDWQAEAENLSAQRDKYRAAYERAASRNFALEAEQAVLQNSLAWKIVQALDHTRSVLVPPRTLREVLFKAGLRRLGLSSLSRPVIPPAPPRLAVPAPYDELLEQSMEAVRARLKHGRRSNPLAHHAEPNRG